MKKRRIFRCWILIAALLLSLTVPLSARERKPRPATTVVGRVGTFLPTSDWRNDGYEAQEDFELALGYHFLPFLSLEAGVHHFSIRAEGESPNYYDFNTNTFGILITPKLIYPGKRLEFYTGIGVGYYQVEYGTHIMLPLYEEYNETYEKRWGFSGVVGASFDIFRWLYLGLDGKYTILTDFTDARNITGWALGISVGFRFL